MYKHEAVTGVHSTISYSGKVLKRNTTIFTLTPIHL